MAVTLVKYQIVMLSIDLLNCKRISLVLQQTATLSLVIPPKEKQN